MMENVHVWDFSDNRLVLLYTFQSDLGTDGKIRGP
jgi:hypothetical protein